MEKQQENCDDDRKAISSPKRSRPNLDVNSSRKKGKTDNDEKAVHEHRYQPPPPKSGLNLQYEDQKLSDEDQSKKPVNHSSHVASNLGRVLNVESLKQLAERGMLASIPSVLTAINNATVTDSSDGRSTQHSSMIADSQVDLTNQNARTLNHQNTSSSLSLFPAVTEHQAFATANRLSPTTALGKANKSSYSGIDSSNVLNQFQFLIEALSQKQTEHRPPVAAANPPEALELLKNFLQAASNQTNPSTTANDLFPHSMPSTSQSYPQSTPNLRRSQATNLFQIGARTPTAGPQENIDQALSALLNQSDVAVNNDTATQRNEGPILNPQRVSMNQNVLLSQATSLLQSLLGQSQGPARPSNSQQIDTDSSQNSHVQNIATRLNDLYSEYVAIEEELQHYRQMNAFSGSQNDHVSTFDVHHNQLLTSRNTTPDSDRKLPAAQHQPNELSRQNAPTDTDSLASGSELATLPFASLVNAGEAGRLSQQETDTKPEFNTNQTTKKAGSIRGKYADTFPDKLYRLLMEVEAKGEQDIVSFTPSGEGFVVNQPDLFIEKITPRYFNFTSFTSFRRQLYLYKFRHTQEGHIYDVYTNANFKRGRPELLRLVRRRPN